MKYAINLFPHAQNTLGKRASYFAIHYLRYVLVLTQLVVVVAFFYRFTVDQEISDEKERLAQKVAIIKATEAMRADLLQKQKSITTIKSILSMQDTWQQRFTYMNGIFPRGVTISSLNYDEDTVLVTGTADNNRLVQELYQRLQYDKHFQSVKLLSMNKAKTGSEYDFVIQLTHFISTTATHG